MSKETSPKNLIQVTLAKPHRHAGRDYKAGEKISVSEPVRNWLLKQKIIIDTPAAATKETK